MPRLAGILAACLVFVPLHAASAQRTSSLSWVRLEGAERCLGAQALAQRVEARVGRPVFVSASQADLSLEGHVQREGDTMVARVVVSDRSGAVLGERVLRVPGADCAALEASLVLVIAIGIDPEATLPEPRSPELSSEARTMLAQLELPKLSDEAVLELAVPDPTATTRVRPAPRQPRAAQTRLPARLEPESAPVRLSLHTGMASELGVLPAPTFGLAVRVALHLPEFWPIELSFYGVLTQTESISAARSGEFGFWAAGLALCPTWFGRASVQLRTCAGARAGVLSTRGTGQGFEQPLSATSSWLDASVQAGPGLALGAFRLDLAGRVSVPVVRDTFVYEDRAARQRTLHRPSAVVAAIELGAGFFF